MAQKKNRQTFEKLKREQAVREKRVRKAERKEAARIAKAGGLPLPGEVVLDETDGAPLLDEPDGAPLLDEPAADKTEPTPPA
jgi:hypothetical protein